MANQAIVGTLRALLTADTGEFETALSRAAASAEKAANRLTQSFQGEKLFKDATAIVDAIDRIGGATKLTANEAQRMSSTLGEAINKLHAQSKPIPELWRQTNKELQQVANQGSAFDRLNAGLAKFGLSLRGLGVAGLATSLISFGKEAMNAADRMVDLRAMTDISLSGLQRLEIVAVKSGSSLEAVAKAVNVLQRNLASGDAGAIKALKDLGLSLEEVRSMDGEQLFKAIGQALQEMTDQNKRALITQELMARGGRELLPALREDYDELTKGVREMSDRTVENLARTKDAWDGLKIAIRNAVGESLAFVVTGESEVIRAQARMSDSAFGLVRAYGELREILRGVDMAAQGAAGALDEAARVASPFAAKMADAGVATKDAELALSQFNRAHGTGESQLRKYESALERIAEETRRVAELHRRVREESEAWRRSQAMSEDKRKEKEALDAMKKVEAQLKANEKAADDFAEAIDRFNAKLHGSIGSPDISKLPGFVDAGAIDAAMKKALPKAPLADRIEDAIGTGLFNAAMDFPDMLANAIIHGRGLSEAVRAVLARGFGDAFADFGKGLAKEGSRASQFLGSAFGAVGGIVGDLIGRGISAIVGALRGKGAKANDIRDALKEAIGGDAAGKGLDKLVSEAFGLAGLGSPLANALDQALKRFSSGDPGTVRRAGEDIKRILEQINEQALKVETRFGRLSGAFDQFGGRAPKSLHPIIEELLRMNNLTEEQRLLLQGFVAPPGWRDIEEVAKRIGVRFESLGENFARMKIGDQALQWVRDLKFLEEAGIDLGEPLRDVSGQLSDLVNEAFKNKAALPETLRPYIERLLEMGLLLDPDGKIRTGIEGLTFKEVEDKPLLEIKGVLEEIRDLLRFALPKAAEDAAEGINRGFGRIRPPAFRTPEVNQGTPETPSFYHGTGGEYTRSGGVAMFHADEAVTPRSDVPNLANDLAAALAKLDGGNDFAVAPVYLDANKVGKVLVYKVKRNDAKGDPKGLKDRWREALDLP